MEGNEKTLQKMYLDFYFGKTLKFIDKIEGRENHILNQIKFSIIGHSDIEKTFNLLNNYISSSEQKKAERLKDFFIIEKERYLSTLQIKDFSRIILDKLTIQKDFQFDWRSCEFCMSEDSKLLVQKFNWESSIHEDIACINEEEDEIEQVAS